MTDDIVTLRCGGMLFEAWTRCEVIRSLTDISGSFSFDYDDRARLMAALPQVGSQLVPIVKAMRAGLPAEISVAGQVVMIGHLEDVRLELLGELVTCSMGGRDRTGDLVDCSTQPQGPYVYRGLDLLAIAQRICSPFGITVSADVDIGDPFAVAAIDASEFALAFLERLARQRGVLITSDGVGGLMLTQAGRSRGPAPLKLPGNIHGIETLDSWRGLFSDYWVKGQTQPLLRPSKAPTLDSSVTPLGGPAPAGSAVPVGRRRSIEAAAITKFGHAIDPTIGRYRPRVWLAPTQSGSSVAAQQAPDPQDPNAGTAATAPSAGSYPGRQRHRRRKAMKPRTDASPWTLQDQAEWRLRQCRATALQQTYVVRGFVDGPHQTLWRPNELVLVEDPFSDVQGDRLISAVGYVLGEDGARTRLGVSDPEAFDLTGDDENTRHVGRRRSRYVGAVDGTKARL